MSKLAFISDIHGNLPALQSVLEDISSLKVDGIYCLGDLVGYYAEINEVIEIIKKNNITCCMGNHDYALVHNKGIIPRSKTCTNVLTRQLEYISHDNFNFIKGLPDKLEFIFDSKTFFCVHGGLNNHIDEYINLNNEKYFDSVRGKYDIVITAHNHIPTVINYDNFLYGNCGSIGQPRDHNPKSSYLVYDNGSLEIKRVKYNIDEVKEQMGQMGFPDYISDVLYKGFRIGEYGDK